MPRPDTDDTPEQELAEGYVGGAPMPPMIIRLMLAGALLVPAAIGVFHGRAALAVKAQYESDGWPGWFAVIGASIDMMMMIAGLAVGIGLLGWAGLMWKRGRDAVTALVTNRRVLATRHDALIWEEPAANYRAVALVREAGSQPDVSYWRLELRHPDADRSVGLGGAPTEAAGTARTQDIARAMGLEAILPPARKKPRGA